METFVCLGLAALLVPITLVVIAALELQKLKKAVSRLGSRLAKLESARTPVEVAPSAPIIKTAPAPSPFVAVPPPLPPRSPIPEPALPRKPVVEPPPIKPPTPPRPARAAIDWEAFLGIKLFAWIGGFVLFLGIVFLVKYSFENNLITPGMRVVIGTAVGLGLIVTGWLTATRRYRASGQSLCATGVLVLYGNVFAAHVFYHLIALVPAFASYAGVVLLLTTLLKLFLHDLGNLSQLYRIGAFIGVAIVLIVASFVYQRFLAPRTEKGPPSES